MIPLKLYIENFMGYTKVELDFTTFNSCLIVGKNYNDERESNGAGKSTIFKAIDFVLFGEYASKHIDEIIRVGTEKCIVSLKFQIQNSIYRATRIRHSRTELKLEEKAGDKWIPKGQRTTKQAAKELAKLIRINYEAFKGSVLFAQGDLSGLAAATPDKRKAMLKEPLLLAIYSKFEEIAKNKIKKIDSELQIINTKLETLGTPQTVIDDYSKRLIQIGKDISAYQTIVDNYNAEADKYRKELAKVSKKLEGATNDLGKLEVINTKCVNQNSKILQCKRNIKENEIETDNKSNSLTGIKKNLKDKKNILKELKLQDLDEEGITKKIKSLNEAEQRGIAYLATLQTKLEVCKHTLPGEEACPQCKQLITDDYREKFVNDNQKSIEEYKKLYGTNNNKLNKLRKDKDKLNNEVIKINNTKKKISTLESEISISENKISTIKEIINQLNKTIKSEKVSLTDYEKELKILDKEKEKLNKELNKSNITSLQEKEKELSQQVAEVERKLSLVLNDLSSKNRELGNAESTIDRAKEDLRKIEAYKKNKIDIEKDLKIKRQGVFAFSPKGIPTLVIHTVIDDLQLEVNKLLQELRPELSVRFIIQKDDKDTLDMVFAVDGTKIDYNLLSGGQKMYLALSIKMGLSLLIQKKLDINIKFLELDEVDQPLDKAGVDAYADVIKRWQNKFKIFVVTHNDALKDKFSHAILVERGHEGATAKVVTEW